MYPCAKCGKPESSAVLVGLCKECTEESEQQYQEARNG